jgi:hypothetical protein
MADFNLLKAYQLHSNNKPEKSKSAITLKKGKLYKVIVCNGEDSNKIIVDLFDEEQNLLKSNFNDEKNRYRSNLRFRSSQPTTYYLDFSFQKDKTTANPSCGIAIIGYKE